VKKLQSELELKKEEKQLEFGQIDFEKNKIKMNNEFKKSFNLERDYYSIKKASTKILFSPKKEIKINFNQNQFENNSILPFIPRNLRNSTSIRTNNSIEPSKKLFISKFGFPKEKVLIRQLEKELQNDKLFYILHPKTNKYIEEILEDDKNFFFQTTKKKLNVSRNKTERNKRYTNYSNEENVYNNSKYISTNSNTSNYFPTSTKFTVESTINNDDDDIPFINKNYKPLKSYSGRFMKEKALNYKKYKMRMTTEDLWEYTNRERNTKTNMY
jgi:hypothetical protein